VKRKDKNNETLFSRKQNISSLLMDE